MKTIKKKVWVVVDRNENLRYVDEKESFANDYGCFFFDNSLQVFPATLTYRLPKKKNKKSTK